MKFSIVRTDRKKTARLSVKTAEWFMKRIQNDTKAGDIVKLREHVAIFGHIGSDADDGQVALIHPSVVLKKTENGRLEAVDYNGVVTIHVPNLLKTSDTDLVKRAAQFLPMTLAAITGCDGRSVEILVAVAQKEDITLQTEDEADLFYSAAYNTAFAIYKGILPMAPERQKATARSNFLMTLDPKPYYNPKATPLMVEQDVANLLIEQEAANTGLADLMATGGNEANRPNMVTDDDFTLYTTYEQKYRLAVEEAYNATANIDESQRQEAYLTRLARNLCTMNVPEEEAFLHIRNHHAYRASYDEDAIRAIVSAVYAEEKPKRWQTADGIGLQTRRLIALLNTRYVFRYNTVLGYTEYRPNNTWVQDWVPCDEKAINGLTIEARLAGHDARDKDVRRYVQSNMIRPSDPIIDYLANVSDKWDGVTDHIGMMARTVPCDIPQWETWFRKWFVSMVAQWMLPNQDYGNSVVPMLISPQGDGKTTFCRMLLPKELRWGFLENLDVSEKRQTLQAMHNYLLINLDEFNQISPKLQEGFLKNVIQLPSVKIKRPYGKHTEEFRRYASFIATTNEVNILADPTGSRRFICVPLTAPVHTDYKPNYEALYGQAYYIVRHHKMQWWFSNEEVQQIMEHNRQFTVLPPAIQYFNEYFEAVDDESKGEWLAPTAIYDILRAKAGSSLQAIGVASFGRYLWNMPGLKHRRIGSSKQYLVRKKD